MKLVFLALILLLVFGFAFAVSDLKIVGVSRLPSSDFYNFNDALSFNITVYNYGDETGSGTVEINATNNEVFQCAFPQVEQMQESVAVCDEKVVIRNLTTLVQVNLLDGNGFVISNKNLTLYSPAALAKKTKVPDSNPLVIISVVLVALIALSCASKKKERRVKEYKNF